MMAFANPPMSLLCKLGSIAIHTEELRSDDGHPFDAAALDQLLADTEVRQWLDAMKGAALLPKKRK